MRFVRHLLAAAIVVALVVGLAFLWKGSSAASLVTNDRDGRRFEQPAGGAPGAPPDGAPRPPAFGEGDRPPFGERDGRFRRDDGAFSLSNIDELASTVVPLALIIGVAVLVDRSRRRKKHAALRASVAS